MSQKSDTTYPISVYVSWRPGRHDSNAMICRAQRLTDEILREVHTRYVPHAPTAADFEGPTQWTS